MPVSMSWVGPARVLAGRAGRDWSGVWSLVYAAGLGVARLAVVPGVGEDLALTYAGVDLVAAAAELEAAHPEVVTRAPAVDLGPAGPADPGVAVGVVVGLLDAAITRVGEMSGTPGTCSGELLALARVQALLLTAREKAAGGVW